MDGQSHLPLNDETDYGLCFACGPRNKTGLQLTFERRGDTVATSFLGRREHQGFPGYVHGGLITALLDEVMSRVFLLDNRWAMTARIDVRFRQPVLLGEKVMVVGQKSREVRGFLEAKGRVQLPSGQMAAEAVGTFSILSQGFLAEISKGYPRLAREWMTGPAE